jgi:FKBP-type peptidyl-prolyl cis-trans isomerase
MKSFIRSTLAAAVAIYAIPATAQQTRPATPPAAPPARPAPVTAGIAPAQPGGAPAPAPAVVPGLTTAKQKAFYAIGYNMGGSFREEQMTPEDVDMQALSRGLMDALSEAKLPLSQQDLEAAMKEYHEQLTAKILERAKAMAEKMKPLGEKAKKEGEAFLAANKSKPDIKTTASGLQYKVLKSGTGATPAATDVATVHYKGALFDGTVFDSSYDRGEPTSFPVNGVIPGWTEALQLMKVGDKWQLFVPSNLAYGDTGRPPKIPPNSVLVFDVELLDIAKQPAVEQIPQQQR